MYIFMSLFLFFFTSQWDSQGTHYLSSDGLLAVQCYISAPPVEPADNGVCKNKAQYSSRRLLFIVLLVT